MDELPAVISNEQELETMEDVYRMLYKEVDGVYYLKVKPVSVGKSHYALEDVAGLKSALGKEKANARSFKDKLDLFEDIDPEAARDALTKIEEMTDWKPEKKVQEQIDAIKAQLEGKHKKEASKWDEEKSFFMNQLRKALIEAEATAAVAKHGVKKGFINLMKEKAMTEALLEKNDKGDYTVRVKGEDGTPRISMNSEGYMTIDELMGSYSTLDEYSGAFDGSGATGSGATGSERGRGTGIRRLTREEASDPATYQRMTEAAKAAGRDPREFLPQ